jgi:hypothetical protein
VCDQVDIKAAFLKGDLEETIHLEPPEGGNIPADKVNNALDEWLKSKGLTPTRADPCVYKRANTDPLLLLSVHVDDQLITCNSRTMLDAFKRIDTLIHHDTGTDMFWGTPMGK